MMNFDEGQEILFLCFPVVFASCGSKAGAYKVAC